MIQTSILVIISILFISGTTIMFSTLGCTILMLCICKKGFSFTIALVINISPGNETNMGTPNRLLSFHYGHNNNVLLVRIHNIDVPNLPEKLSFLSFSLQLKFIHEVRQTWILITISIPFAIGTAIMLSTLGYRILML